MLILNNSYQSTLQAISEQEPVSMPLNQAGAPAYNTQLQPHLTKEYRIADRSQIPQLFPQYPQLQRIIDLISDFISKLKGSENIIDDDCISTPPKVNKYPIGNFKPMPKILTPEEYAANSKSHEFFTKVKEWITSLKGHI